MRLLSAYWKMQWYLAAFGRGHRKWVLRTHLFPCLSCLTSSLHVRCFVHCYSPMLTDGQSRDNGCTLGGQRPGYLYAVISADECGQSCRPLFGQQTIGVCPLFHLAVSWLLTCLSPSPFRWNEFPGPPVLREIFLHLVHKAISDPKTNNKYNASCWAGYVLPNLYGYDNFLWAKSFFLIAQ